MRKTVAFAALCVTVCAASPAFAQGVKLKTTPFPDGTGSIGIAPGWHLESAYNGGVGCSEPGGAVVILKLPYTILRPESSVAQLPASATAPMAQAGDLIGALRSVLEKTNGKLGTVRGRKLGNLPSGAPTYLLHYQFKQNGRDYTAIGYFAPLDYGADQPMWQLYSSAVAAPTPQFTKQLPAMLAMWKSWRPNGKKPREGSASAVFDEILKNRKASYDEIQKKFREQ
ncbi:MAG: hypothetical protein H7Y38_05700, partial [Armatimonadetes bacterium]|nr:hypothetical protein [Armatimonadota bacterium]